MSEHHCSNCPDEDEEIIPPMLARASVSIETVRKSKLDEALADLAASQAREQALRAALKKYGMHIDIGCCDVDDPRTCVCGLLDILAADPVERGALLLKAREGG